MAYTEKHIIIAAVTATLVSHLIDRALPALRSMLERRRKS